MSATPASAPMLALRRDVSASNLDLLPGPSLWAVLAWPGAVVLVTTVPPPRRRHEVTVGVTRGCAALTWSTETTRYSSLFYNLTLSLALSTPLL